MKYNIIIFFVFRDLPRTEFVIPDTFHLLLWCQDAYTLNTLNVSPCRWHSTGHHRLPREFQGFHGTWPLHRSSQLDRALGHRQRTLGQFDIRSQNWGRLPVGCNGSYLHGYRWRWLDLNLQVQCDCRRWAPLLWNYLDGIVVLYNVLYYWLQSIVTNGWVTWVDEEVLSFSCQKDFWGSKTIQTARHQYFLIIGGCLGLFLSRGIPPITSIFQGSSSILLIMCRRL